MSSARRLNPALSRTSSSTSVASDATVVPTTSSRTRRRFSSAQVTMLEALYHTTAHPTREARERVAREAAVDPKSVTVWFQNKRQTERKVSLASSAKTTTKHRAAPSEPTRRQHALSLDRVATMSELRTPSTSSRTYTYTPSAHASTPLPLWASMPSSPPPSPPSSPIHLRRARPRTLEWACAAAAARNGNGSGRREEKIEVEGLLDDGDETEEDDDAHEAVTPKGSFSARAVYAGDGEHSGVDASGKAVDASGKAVDASGKAMGGEGKAADDEDMMKAALALCGLGRRRI
ncbi:hypothetical protein PLICRDRAFT_694368 [Plicaturopsis crispa FD-325 SS-3]|nr:hypothetical protein PLICRDRAFT_694368 [Plicaturopsis crispa FD-325 SS-3]